MKASYTDLQNIIKHKMKRYQRPSSAVIQFNKPHNKDFLSKFSLHF